jgi:hypothetical protein
MGNSFPLTAAVLATSVRRCVGRVAGGVRFGGMSVSAGAVRIEILVLWLSEVTEAYADETEEAVGAEVYAVAQVEGDGGELFE